MGERNRTSDHWVLKIVIAWTAVWAAREAIAQTPAANQGLRLASSIELESLSWRGMARRGAGDGLPSPERPDRVAAPALHLALARELAGAGARAPEPGAADPARESARPAEPVPLPRIEVAQAAGRPVVFPIEGDPKPKRDDGPKWGLAPVTFRWSGITSLDMTRHLTKESSGNQRLSMTTLNGSAASYVWQPYIAQVNGNLGLTYATSATESDDSKTLGLLGGGRVAVFPFSRFPFEAYFDRNDSRASGELTSSNYRNTRFGLKQSYRTEAGDASYVGGIDRHELSGESVNDTLDVVQFNMNQRAVLFERTHTFSGTANFTRNTHIDLPQARSFSLGAGHGFRPDEDFSLQNDASFSGSRFADARADVYQLSSVLTWTPQETPLVATGAARFSGFNAGAAGSTSRQNAFTLSGNASYAYSRNLNFTGGASMTAFSDKENATTQFAGASYQADPREVAGFTYTRGASATASNQTGELSSQNVVGSLNHGLTKFFPEIIRGTLSLTGTQGVSAGVGSFQGTIPNTLTHSVSAGWTVAEGTSQTAITSTATDQRNFGGNTDSYQLFTVRGTRNTFLTRVASLAATISFDVARRHAEVDGSTSTSVLTNALVSYQNSSFFGVPRLTFTSNLSANLQNLSVSAAEAPNRDSGRNVSWENFARYRIGRTDFQLRAQVAKSEGANLGIIFFRMSRELGN
ncbi:MAG: hypothetical protein HYU77_15305 [Betaproteobacteria bacterium]|nr:hypothetical protein [Betaproteobacteria bacterium]